MISKQDVLDALLKECDICIHLHSKIPDGGLAYKPTPVQWNTLQLLQYISHCGIGMTEAMIDGHWDGYKAHAEAAQNLTAEDFPKAMEKQKQLLTEKFATITDAELKDKEATSPLGETMSLGRALLDIPFRCLSGYRMQLFLYAKAAGNYELKSPNLWGGIDMEMGN